ncbi:MAG: DUF3090 family protein [Actinobacteria bacterium]|nr:DUF3090 family protein [Actinomycetota bacterium]
MPRIIYRHDEVSRFIVSAIGQPGEREFFLQVKSMDGINTIAVEKEQVRALAEQLDNLITELRRSGLVDKRNLAASSQIDNDPLEPPIEADFQLGVASIAWKNEAIEIALQAISSDELILLDDLNDGPDLVVAKLSIEVAKGFCQRANELIKKGRSACPFCGLPMNISGHLCPRANGYRR